MSHNRKDKDIRTAKPDAGKKPVKKKDKKARRSLVRVFKDTLSEIKKVTWPTKKELINHTAIVAAFVVVMMVIVGLIDTGLSALFGLLIS